MIPTHVGHVLLLEIPYRHLLILFSKKKLWIVENVLQRKNTMQGVLRLQRNWKTVVHKSGKYGFK